jgi:hypothetical protein
LWASWDGSDRMLYGGLALAGVLLGWHFIARLM